MSMVTTYVPRKGNNRPEFQLVAPEDSRPRRDRGRIVHSVNELYTGQQVTGGFAHLRNNLTACWLTVSVVSGAGVGSRRSSSPR